MRRAWSLFIPLVILAAPSIALQWWPDYVAEVMRKDAPVWAGIFDKLPYVLAAMTCAFAWQFGQVKVTYLSALLAGLFAAIEIRGTADPYLWTIPAILLCVVYALLFWLRESRLFSTFTLGKIALVFVCLATAFGLKPFSPTGPFGVVQNSSMVQWCLPGTEIRGNLAIAYGAAFVLLFLGRSSTRRVLSAGFATSLAAALFGLNSTLPGWYPLLDKEVVGHQTAVFVLHFLAAWILLLYAVYSLSWGRAYLDELTGLGNRRSMEEALERIGRRFVIAMVDIDHFKKVNDVHGHRVGDEVLAFTASKIRKARIGKAYRYGGEEFAIICRKNTEKDAFEDLETLRKTIMDAKFFLRTFPRDPKWRGKQQGKPRKTLSITVSIGVAERTKESPKPKHVVQAADQAMYKAKKSGRNKTLCATMRVAKNRKSK